MRSPVLCLASLAGFHARAWAMGAAVLAALAIVARAEATPPTTFTEVVDQTVFAPATSAACGFPVFVTQRGTVHVTLFYGHDGLLVREADWGSHFEFIFTAPTQGTSFRFPYTQRLVTYYEDGAVLGSSARAVLVGLVRANGDTVPPDTGRIELTAVVVFIGPGGIPGIDFVDVVQQSGRFEGIDIAARCAALSAS